jgi:hypothetical protein
MGYNSDGRGRGVGGSILAIFNAITLPSGSNKKLLMQKKSKALCNNITLPYKL